MGIENQTLLKLAAGDHQAFKVIFQTYFSKVRTFSYGILKNMDEAEEVTQLTFIKLWEKRELFKDVHNFDSYLFKLSKYTIFNYIEAKHLIPTEVEDLPMEPDMRTPYDNVVAHDLELLIELVVSNMPTQRQQVFRLSRFEGVSNDDIAKKLGIQKKTVENHLNLALKELKKVTYMVLLAYNLLMH